MNSFYFMKNNKSSESLVRNDFIIFLDKLLKTFIV